MVNVADNNREAPKVIWRTAIGRSELEFGSLLYTPLKDFFLDAAHIQALAVERDKLSRQLAVFFFISILIAFLIHLNRAELSVSLRSPVGEIAELPISLELLMFALAATTSYYAQRFVSVLLITKQLQTILNHLGHPRISGLNATEHVASRWSAATLWSDVMMIRTAGYRSSKLHVAIVLMSLLVILMIALSQLAIILSASYVGATHLATVSSPFAFWMIVLPSVVAVHLALILPILVMTVPLRFELLAQERAESKPPTPEK